MKMENQLPPENQGTPAFPPGSSAEQTQPPLPEDTSRAATIIAPKALLHEIKSLNKAGRPVMRIHEPRQRFDTGAVLQVAADELVADGGVIYLLCTEHPDLYVRKVDVSIAEG